MEEGIIHIQWQGPFSLTQLDTLKDPRKDRGLYQIYGHHPVYGANVLLYIGQTMGETFGKRIEEHNFGGGFQEDREHVEIYVGRLKGVSTPSSDEWRNEINWAEKLLIHVHDPAYNSRQNTELDEADPRVCNARVMNWGCIRALQPEVSGRRWTKAKTDETDSYKVYEMPDPSAAAPARSRQSAQK
jgi:hypothetical protein